MATNQLTAGNGSGSQTTTQSPQNSAPANNNAARSSSVQPGTAAGSLVTSQGGVALQPQPLTTVALKSTTTGTVNINQPVAKPHHANPILIGFTVLFFLLALGLFWVTSRSVKSTTEYQ